MSDLSLLDLPDDVLSHLIRQPGAGQRLLGVSRRLRALCHATATSVALTRDYEGTVDDAHVAILARCPQLRRVDASALIDHVNHMPWPLAAATQVTSLTVGPCWGARNLPPALAELHCLLAARNTANDHQWQRALSLVQRLRDTRCSVLLSSLECGRRETQALSAAWMHGRVFALQGSRRFGSPSDALSGELFAPGALLSRVRVLCLDLREQSLAAYSACWVPSLTRLRLSGGLTTLQGLGGRRLAALQLFGCDSLTSLSDISGVSSLRELEVCGCSALVNLGVARGGMPRLESLAVACAQELTALDWGCDSPASPSDEPWEASLRKLELRDCRSLVRLGIHSPALSRLESLVVHHASALTALGWGAADQGRLRRLELTRAPQLDAARQLGALTALESARIDAAAAAAPLPTALLHLDLCVQGAAPGETSIHLLTSVRRLELRNVLCLPDLTGLGALRQLTSLDVGYCRHLRSLEGLSAAPSLVSVVIDECPSLVSVDALRDAPTITSFSLRRCLALRTLQGLDGCPGLRSVNVHDTRGAEFSGALRALSALSSVGLGAQASVRGAELDLDCSSLEAASLRNYGSATLHVFAGASALTRLSVAGSDFLTSLRGLEGAVRLRCAHIASCEALTDLAPLASLPVLSRLVLSDCPGVSGLQGLQGSARLASFTLDRCDVDSVEPLAALPSLQVLECTRCSQISRLDGVGGFRQLTFLRFDLCRALSTLAGLGDAPRLDALVVTDCRALQSLGAQSAFTRLQHVHICVKNCPALTLLENLLVHRL